METGARPPRFKVYDWQTTKAHAVRERLRHPRKQGLEWGARSKGIWMGWIHRRRQVSCRAPLEKIMCPLWIQKLTARLFLRMVHR